jgi:uncharacterized protein YbjT (DUF2867 family)
MNVLLFGATGMVGQGVLRECLLDPDVVMVQTLGRTTTGRQHPKLREVAVSDLSNYAPVEDKLSGFDACFFCLGVSAAGMTEREYTRVTYAFTVAAAETLSRLNPNMTFVYVSGAGTDSSEKGRSMWARVKGRTENALFRQSFKATYAFRPAAIQPLYGAVSKTASYRILYSLTKPLLSLLRCVFPGYITTTEQIGLVMLQVAKQGAPKRILESSDIAKIGRTLKGRGLPAR